MHFATLSTAILAGLAPSASAFVIATFRGPLGCSETLYDSENPYFIAEYNIYDNTCKNDLGWDKGFQSYKIKYWGGPYQFASFYEVNECRPPGYEHALSVKKADLDRSQTSWPDDYHRLIYRDPRWKSEKFRNSLKEPRLYEDKTEGRAEIGSCYDFGFKGANTINSGIPDV